MGQPGEVRQITASAITSLTLRVPGKGELQANTGDADPILFTTQRTPPSASSSRRRRARLAQAEACTDTPGWLNQFGADCAVMVSDGHCEDGAFAVDSYHKWVAGPNGSPEENCCSCGKGAAKPGGYDCRVEQVPVDACLAALDQWTAEQEEQQALCTDAVENQRAQILSSFEECDLLAGERARLQAKYEECLALPLACSGRGECNDETGACACSDVYNGDALMPYLRANCDEEPHCR